MALKIYVRDLGPMGWPYRTPYEKFLWTGRYKLTTINNNTTMYLERWVRLFGIIPLFRTWESEHSFLFLDEEINIYNCNRC